MCEHVVLLQQCNCAVCKLHVSFWCIIRCRIPQNVYTGKVSLHATHGMLLPNSYMYIGLTPY